MSRPLVESLVKKRSIYKGNAVTFRVDEVRLPNGKLATREFIDHPGAVGVVPLLEDGRVVLVRQYRHPVREITLELPAGKLNKGENALSCVRRELQEETGYTAQKISRLIDYWPTPAFASEVLHLFLAEGLVAGPVNPDEDEFLEVVDMPFEKALSLAKSGRIRDSKTVIGLLACAAWRSVRRKNYTK